MAETKSDPLKQQQGLWTVTFGDRFEEEKQLKWTTTDYQPRRNASPAFGNPARSGMTSVGFATLVHTRCAFVVSGTASNNCEPLYLSTQEKT